jgi:hypothetical protein
MTVTLERPTEPDTVTEPRDPRELVSEATFAKLVRYMTTHQEVHRFYAEREVGQMLVFLKAICDSPGVRLVPDLSVDPTGTPRSRPNSGLAGSTPGRRLRRVSSIYSQVCSRRRGRGGTSRVPLVGSVSTRLWCGCGTTTEASPQVSSHDNRTAAASAEG